MAENYDRLIALARSNPEEFRRLMNRVSEKVIQPHPGQQVVLDSKARFRIMNCGRRFGKTVLAAKIAVSKTRKANQMIWWVAPTYKIVKRGYEQVLAQLPDGVLAHDPPPETNFDAGRSVILRFKNGSKMEFYSAERPEGMLGAAVDFAVLDEAAIMKAHIWNQIIQPTLMDRLGGALMISTPRGHNWFYRMWQKGQDPQERDYDSWTFTTQDNPTLPEGEADRMAADMPRLEADQEIYAKWIAAGSSVFMLGDRCVQEARVLPNGLVEGMPPKGHVVLGIDLAKTNDYTVIYGCNARNRRNCYFERFNAVTWPEQKRRIKRAVRTLMRSGASGVLMMMDSTGVGDPIVDDMEAAGYDVIGLNFTTHKINMVKLLAKDLEENRAFILDTGQDEFQSYTMNLTPSGKPQYSAPEGEHDDIVSAKMLQHWGCVMEGVPEIQMISADDIAPVNHQEDDPYGDPEDDEDYSDLLDDDEDMSDEEAARAVGLTDYAQPPSPQELLLRPDLWL